MSAVHSRPSQKTVEYKNGIKLERINNPNQNRRHRKRMRLNHISRKTKLAIMRNAIISQGQRIVLKKYNAPRGRSMM
jgi:hypothetical protein